MGHTLRKWVGGLLWEREGERSLSEEWRRSIPFRIMEGGAPLRGKDGVWDPFLGRRVVGHRLKKELINQ